MNASDLLEDLRRRDVILEAEGDSLHVDAPAGAITDDLRAALVENKERLLERLARERQKLEKAGRRGLAIRWFEYPTWIALHDPSTGEWHEWPAADCFPSMVAEANRHRQIRRRRG
jgi:predicted metal-dependent hydrolase